MNTNYLCFYFVLKYFLNHYPWHYLFIFPPLKFLFVCSNRSLLTSRFVWELCLHNLWVSLAQVFLLTLRPSWKLHPCAVSVSLPGSLYCTTFLYPELVDSHTREFSWPLPKHLYNPRRSLWHTGYQWPGITQSLQSLINIECLKVWPSQFSYMNWNSSKLG